MALPRLARGRFWAGVVLCGVALAGCSGDGPVQPTGVGPAAKLAFTVLPSTAVAGGVITPAVQVAVRDAQGNTVTTATTSVTVAIGTNPANGILSGTTTVAAVSGVATFSNLSLNPAGTGYTLTASAAGLTGATSGSVAVSAASGSVSIGFCSASYPGWVAVQDGNGPWTRVLPNAGTTTYEFSLASGKGGLALVDTNATYPSVDVRYESLAEFTAQLSGDLGPLCRSLTRTVNGSVAHVGPTEQAEVSLGFSFADVTPGSGAFPLFQLTNVGDNPLDLVATRGGFTEFAYAVDKVIVRRALSPADNGTLLQLDFDAEGFVPDSANVTVTGLGADSLTLVSSTYLEVGGEEASLASLSLTFFGAASQSYRAIPLAQLNANDFQLLGALALSANRNRTAGLSFRNPLNQTLALGPDLNTPVVTKLVTAPNARPRVQLASQPEYNSSVLAFFAQSTLQRSVAVTAEPGYYGGAPATWDVTVPDLSAAAGWNSAWGLQDGTPIDYWGVSAQGGLTLGIATIDSPFRQAGISSSTPLAQSALRSPPDPRASRVDPLEGGLRAASLLRECAAIASRLCSVSFSRMLRTWDFTVSPATPRR